MPLTLESSKIEPNVYVLHLHGSLDAHTHNQLKTELDRLFTQRRYHVLLDLSNLDYLSSAGITILLDAFNVAQDNEGNLVLLHPVKPVQDILELIGIHQIIPMTQDTASALRFFKHH